MIVTATQTAPHTNLSKPSAMGPSASRVAEQNKRTITLGTVLSSTSGVYTRSDSPEFSNHPLDEVDDSSSDSSSGSSQAFQPNLSDGDSHRVFA